MNTQTPKIIPNQNVDEFDMTPREDTSLLSVDAARAVAQIQCAMTIAKRFPRDENQSLNRIVQAAKRRKVAEKAEYEYNKGGSSVAGPSIRAAETVAQAWGNMISGVTEVVRDSDKKESLMLAYSADMETNNWKFLEWRVPHTQDRSAGKGGAKALESGRDIYERTMNDGSRRLRNCILAVIPGDVMETFIEECDRTLSSSEIPLKVRLSEMHKAMENIGVTQPMIEHKMGCSMVAITERQLAQLRRIYQSIKDGFGKVGDYFQASSDAQARTQDFLDKVTAPAMVTNKQVASDLSPSNEAKKDEVIAKEPQGAFDSFKQGFVETPKLVDEGAPEFGTETHKPHPDLLKSHQDLVLEVVAAADKLGVSLSDVTDKCLDHFKVPPRELTRDQLIEVRNFYLKSPTKYKTTAKVKVK